ncbi:MAG: hypothetical protein JRJ01_16195 [Deltaproteobacteria bacterium]|nr:hypothetical protein [Deltaproteobacteria bacterium]
MGGVVGGPESPTASLYFHKVRILVGPSQFETWAGFSWKVSWGGLLGMKGFFENFKVGFDFSCFPPEAPKLEIERINRI